jgi:hypothetical protein
MMAHNTADQRFVENKSQVIGNSNMNFTAFPSGGPTQLSTTNRGEETSVDLRGTNSPLGGISSLEHSGTPDPNYLFTS